MRLQLGKTLLGGAFLALGVIMLQVANAPRSLLFVSPGEMDAMAYPKALIYGWLVVTALYLFFPAKDQPDWPGVKRCAVELVQVAASIAAYIIMFSYLGLALSTFLFLLLFFFFMGYRDPRKALPIALAGAVITWVVFEKLLGVTMPVPFWIEYLY